MHCYIACLALIVVSGCQIGSPSKVDLPKSQELRINIHSDPPTLDPRKALDSVSIGILRMCFDGLMAINDQGDAVPALASHYQVSADHRTYTFFLRDAKWSDGVEVTAFDFESTWKTVLNPSFHSEFASDLYILKNGLEAKSGTCPLEQVGVRALDAKTLEVELTHPVPYFPGLTASHVFFAVPKHIVEQFPHWADQAGPHYIGNGPFFLTVWQRHSRLELKKSPTYWDRDVVRLETIFLSLVEDENTELALFENGELDWSGTPFSSLPLDAIPTLKKKKEVIIHPISGTYYYVFNTKKYPFDNVHIRRAFALAINRQSITENVTQSGQVPALGLIPPTMWKQDRHYFKDNDRVEAKKELEIGLNEMGITVEQFPKVTLSYNTLSSHHKIAQAIQEQWLKTLGIKVQLENKEWKVFLDQLSHHQFHIARMGGSAGFNDPTTFLDLYRYLSSSNNYPRWANALFTDLLEQADVCIDQEKRMLLLKQAERVLMDEMPIAPIYFYTATYLKKPYVKGAFVSDLSHVNLKTAYIEKE